MLINKSDDDTDSKHTSGHKRLELILQEQRIDKKSALIKTTWRCFSIFV